MIYIGSFPSCQSFASACGMLPMFFVPYKSHFSRRVTLLHFITELTKAILRCSRVSCACISTIILSFGNYLSILWQLSFNLVVTAIQSCGNCHTSRILSNDCKDRMMTYEHDGDVWT